MIKQPQTVCLNDLIHDLTEKFSALAETNHIQLEANIIQVQDTGIGIAPTDQAHIFDRFYRMNRDRSRQTGGAGLGLAIAQAIAQAHQGSLHVQSELGRGSTFTVHLPLKPTSNPAKNYKKSNLNSMD